MIALRGILLTAITGLVATVAAADSAVSADQWIDTAALSTATGVEADAMRASLRDMHRHLESGAATQAYSPAEVAWICEALNRAALYDEAEALLLRALGEVRGEDAQPLPRGSMPALITGSRAAPPSPYVFDAEAGAWLLAALLRHAEARPDRAGVAFTARHWSTLAAMGDFLEGWRLGYDPEPLYTHLAEAGHSGLKQQMIFSFYLGLSSADKLSGVIGRRAPRSWAARIRTLNALVKSRALDRDVAVPLEAPFASYLSRLDPALAEEAPVTVRVGDTEEFLEDVPVLPPETWVPRPACAAALQFLRASDALYGKDE